MRRDSYLDGWRGLFHVIMLTDHLPLLFPGLFTLIAWFYEALGYVSVAEGFVFLSGYVTGLVYTRVKQERGDLAMWRKSVLRAFTIYATYVVATILLLSLVKLGSVAHVWWGSWGHLLEQPLPTASLEVASLVWQPSFLEILPMYSLFLLVAPPIISQLEQRRHGLVLGLSGLVWAANQLGVRGRLLTALGIGGGNFNVGYFNSLAWQILFVGGLICGHRTYRAKGAWLPKAWFIPIAAYGLAVLFFAWRHRVVEIPIGTRWVERSTLGPLRLLNFACFVFLAARFRHQLAKIIRWKGFAFLSRQSLQVFAFHLIPIYLASLLVLGQTRLRWWEQILFVGASVAGLFCIAWFSQLVKRLVLKRSMPAACTVVEIVEAK